MLWREIGKKKQIFGGGKYKMERYKQVKIVVYIEVKAAEIYISRGTILFNHNTCLCNVFFFI